MQVSEGCKLGKRHTVNVVMRTEISKWVCKYVFNYLKTFLPMITRSTLQLLQPRENI